MENQYPTKKTTLGTKLQGEIDDVHTALMDIINALNATALDDVANITSSIVQRKHCTFT